MTAVRIRESSYLFIDMANFRRYFEETTEKWAGVKAIRPELMMRCLELEINTGLTRATFEVLSRQSAVASQTETLAWSFSSLRRV